MIEAFTNRARKRATKLRDNFWDWASENNYEFDPEAFYDLMEADFKNNGFDSRLKWLFVAISNREKNIEMQT